MAVTRNFRLKWVTSRNTRTCAIRTTISISARSTGTTKSVNHLTIAHAALSVWGIRVVALSFFKSGQPFLNVRWNQGVDLPCCQEQNR
jgi:hypothetical protein